MQRQLVSSGTVWESVVGYSRAVRVGPSVSVAGTTAAAEGRGAVGVSDMAAPAREALGRIAVAIEQDGSGLQYVVHTGIFVTDISRWLEVGQVHGEVFGAISPATSMLEVSALIDPALLVETEADAVSTPSGKSAEVGSRTSVRTASSVPGSCETTWRQRLSAAEANPPRPHRPEVRSPA